MPRVRIEPMQATMGCSFADIPAFPGERFGMGVPESIGDAARAVWFGPQIRPQWEPRDDGVWTYTTRVEGELSYTVTMAPSEDTVDVAIALTNESDRAWRHSLAFNCFQCGGSPSVNDHECVRHWVGTGGELRRLPELPRKFGPRPTVQLWGVEGGPSWRDIPFVAGFAASPDTALEGWLVIVARDGRRLVATASRPTLFLFQNMEYSCIHSAPGFGSLQPGETGSALTRLYFVEASVEEWHARMRRELA